MRVGVSDAWDKDVCFEYDFEQVMFRFDAKQKKFYRKFYGTAVETEVASDDKLLFDAESGENRIISIETYRRDRVFDRTYLGSRQSVLLHSTASPVDLMDYLGLAWQAAAQPDHIRSTPQASTVVITEMPLTQNIARRASASFADHGINVVFHNSRAALSQDPETYQFELSIVTRLIAWDRADAGLL